MEKMAAENILAETRMTMELLFPAVKHDQIHPFSSLSGKQGNHETAGLVWHSKYQVIILIVTEVKPGEFIVSQITSQSSTVAMEISVRYCMVWLYMQILFAILSFFTQVKAKYLLTPCISNFILQVLKDNCFRCKPFLQLPCNAWY